MEALVCVRDSAQERSFSQRRETPKVDEHRSSTSGCFQSPSPRAGIHNSWCLIKAGLRPYNLFQFNAPFQPKALNIFNMATAKFLMAPNQRI